MSTPSDRINLIREIASRLGNEEWPLIDLTLEQFSLPTSDEAHGGRSPYVIAMISGASSETLTELAAHVGFEPSSGRPVVEPDFWAPGHFRLFASHLSDYRDFTTQLKTQLESYQISTFVAHRDITPTRQWEDEIQLALSTADALVALLHPGFHASYWTDQEVGFVIGRGRLAVAVRLGEDPYGFIGRLQAFSGIDKSEADLAREIFDAFADNKQTSRTMAHSILTRFEQSHSFADAKRNVGLLEKIEYWENNFEDRILRAVRENGQVKDSFGVPTRAALLIRKWNPAPETDNIMLEPEDIPFE